MRKDCHKPTYTSWHNMKSRCDHKTSGNYSRYGAVGVTYSSDWSNYDQFLEDMGERPEGMTLDRIDSSKGYSKDNCRWATPAQQQANRKNCMHLTYNGVTQTAAEWSRSIGLTKAAVWQRIVKYGWTVEQALTLPKGARP